ncbi:MAG: thiamine pyrophosphate-binding protein [Proteobacteria bacterium]|nr:thiamine pyrophosphate-binding protein [Pseudomonadota bacterium]
MSVVRNLRTKTVQGGEIVTRLLAAEGVSRVFGIIDGTYFGMYSTFGEHDIELITPRHESSAVHMAGGYARLTGKLGVCIASNGPGAANALPGVAVENAEGNRVLLITSSRRHAIVEPDRGGTFQCFPQTAAIAAMAKFSVHVPSFDRIAELTRRALRMCFTGRPGLVHLDIPEDLMNQSSAEQAAWFVPPAQYRSVGTFAPRPADVKAAADLLLAADRPLLHAGSGVLHATATAELIEVAELLGAPVTTSWAARAALDERHELAIPMLYLDAVAAARKEADAVLVLGSRLGETDWWGKAPYWAPAASQRMVQVDLDPETIGNIRPVEVPVQADIREFLTALAEHLRTRRKPGRRPWIDGLHRRIAKRRKTLDKHLTKTTMPMHPAHVPVAAQEVFGDDAIVVVDGGNTAIWTNFFTQIRRPGSLLTTPKMGMLGAGCSQVLAAKVAFPDRPAYCIIGDGAMGFHPQEVETAVRNGLQVVWIVLCDKQWGMVKINQQFALKPIKTLVRKTLSPEETINADLGEIEFDVLARSMGAHGERVADPAGLRGALERAVASGKPAVVHVDVDPVAHMWAPNLKDFKDIHAEPAGA